jgi:hypothetical protein
MIARPVSQSASSYETRVTKSSLEKMLSVWMTFAQSVGWAHARLEQSLWCMQENTFSVVDRVAVPSEHFDSTQCYALAKMLVLQAVFELGSSCPKSL